MGMVRSEIRFRAGIDIYKKREYGRQPYIPFFCIIYSSASQ